MPKIKPFGRFLKWVIPSSYIAITLAPFGIYLSKEYYDAYTKDYAHGYENSLTDIDLYHDYCTSVSIVNHEKIHWEQQMEMCILPFYLWYFIEWLLKDCNYYSISFEHEAYEYEDYIYLSEYLVTRPRFAWFKYI